MRNLLQNHWMPLIVLMVVSAVTLLRFDRPLIRGDGVAYLAWTDTLVLDGDVNLNNQFERFRPVNTYHITWNFKTERWVIIFPFGVAFLQAPFYLTGHLFAQNDWLNYNSDYFQQMQGVELPYSLWIMFGTNLMTLVALALNWDVGRRYCTAWLAATVVYLVFVNTPLLYYSTVEPLNSHGSAAFTFTVVMWVLFTRREKGLWWMALLGFMAGMTVLVRWQLLLTVIPVYVLLVVEKRWRALLVAGVTMGITLLPLPVIWQEMFGSPFVIPFNEVTDESFLQTSNQFHQVLWMTVITSPVTLLCVPGFYFLFNKQRWEAVMMAVMIIAQLFINGAAGDWNAGYSYGMRRMTELFPVYVIFACVTFGAAESAAAQVGRKSLIWLVRIIPLVLTVYAFVYLLSFLSYIWTSPVGWLGQLTPDSVIPYFLNQPHNIEVINSIFTTHLGPPAWKQPGP